jgi:putative oxidoreductase
MAASPELLPWFETARYARLLTMRPSEVELYIYILPCQNDGAMLDPSTSLIFPSLGPLYEALAPWAEALLRVSCGLALIPHGLRNTFGLFPKTGVRAHNLTELAAQLDYDGYRPGKLWAPAISITQLIAGPLLALGLFTRVAALPIVLFLIVSNVERWRVGKYFWNQLGLEYTLMWTIVAFYFLVHGSGTISLDHLIGRAV